jgi:hypothetical protein
VYISVVGVDRLSFGYLRANLESAFGVSEAEAQRGESLDRRLAQEIPDEPLPSTGPASRTDVDDEGALAESGEFFDGDEVGDERSGRLVAPDEGLEPDVEADLIGREVGIDGGSASVEEAAIHIVEFP